MREGKSFKKYEKRLKKVSKTLRNINLRLDYIFVNFNIHNQLRMIGFGDINAWELIEKSTFFINFFKSI